MLFKICIEIYVAKNIFISLINQKLFTKISKKKWLKFRDTDIPPGENTIVRRIGGYL